MTASAVSRLKARQSWKETIARESKSKPAKRDLSFGSYRSDFSMSEFDSDGQGIEEEGSVASEVAMNKGKNRLCDLRK